MSEQHLILVKALVVDDQVQWELDLTVYRECLKALESRVLAGRLVGGVEVEFALL